MASKVLQSEGRALEGLQADLRLSTYLLGRWNWNQASISLHCIASESGVEGVRVLAATVIAPRHGSRRKPFQPYKEYVVYSRSSRLLRSHCPKAATRCFLVSL
jgi:hypothetical protein